jgi:hypothetical protein
VLLKTRSKDLRFKRKLRMFVSAEEIKIQEIQRFVSTMHGFTSLGQSFHFFGLGKLALAFEKASRDAELAEGSDKFALYFLRSIIRISDRGEMSGEVLFQRLDIASKIEFSAALTSILGVSPNPTLERAALALEVDLNCQLKGAAFFRMGKYGQSTLMDYLMDGPSDVRQFAVDQFDRLHERNVHVYDGAYPGVLVALQESKPGRLRDRLVILRKRIEKTDPSATLPAVAGQLLSKKENLANPVSAITKESHRRQLTQEDSCILSLMIAKQLLSLGYSQEATEVLSQAILYSGGDAKLLGWLGYELGDILNASRALLRYGTQIRAKTRKEAFEAETEAYHAIELAARLLFEGDVSVFYDEIEFFINRLKFRKKREGVRFALRSALDRLEQWLTIRSGFGAYLRRRIKSSHEPFDFETPSMLQRRIAERLFLQDAKNSQLKHLGPAMAKFEQASSHNDAPWIRGSRALFLGIKASLSAFDEKRTSRYKYFEQARRLFANSSRLLGSTDPLALSLSFRALYKSAYSVKSTSILDLTRAAEMLSPRTPEIAELKDRVLDARWNLIERTTKDKQHGSRQIAGLWRKIACVGPLLDDVIDEDNRLEWHFSPAPEIWESKSGPTTLEDILRIGNHHKRGKLLEELIVGLIQRSRELAVVDVRHKNNFEEIDIIAKLVQPTPVLAHFGPIFIIECKNWREPIGTEPLRSFYAKMATKKGAVRLGIFVAPSGFKSGAKEQIRQFPDSLILTITGKELGHVIEGEMTFGELLDDLVPLSLFA